MSTPRFEVVERRSTEQDSRILIGLPLPPPALSQRVPLRFAGMVVGGGMALGGVVSHLTQADLLVGLGGGGLLGAAGTMAAMAWPALRRRRARFRWRKRLKQHRTQVIQVRGARWRRLLIDGCQAPVLLGEVAPRQVLLLWGDSLMEPSLYGCYDARLRQLDTVNGLPPPFAFPCADFTLVRSPRTGMILRLRPLGPPVQPALTRLVLDRQFDFPESGLFKGSIDEPLRSLRPDRQLEVA